MVNKIMNFVLNRKESKRILSKIFEDYKIEDFDFDFDNYVLLRNTKDRLYIIKRETFEFPLEKLKIDSMGMYIGSIEKDGIRLSIEGSQFFGSHSHNWIEIDDAISWMKGNDIDYHSDEKKYAIIKHGSDFIGSGKVTGNKILNYIPKVRRINTKD